MSDIGFGEALEVLKKGGRVTRRRWDGDSWLKIMRPHRNVDHVRLNDLTLPFIMMLTAEEDYVPYHATNSDLLADDWVEVPVGYAPSDILHPQVRHWPGDPESWWRG